MRRLCLVLLLVAFCSAPSLPAQDGVEQRLSELSGRIETLLEGLETQRKQIADLAREVDRLRDQVNKPQAEAASPEDVRRVADAVREVDRKRLEDYEKIRAELLKLGKTLSAAAPVATPKASPPEKARPETPEKGYEYEVQKGDTLSVIVQAYRERGIKVNTEQILKANPGLVPERLRVGQKIFIPAQ